MRPAFPGAMAFVCLGMLLFATPAVFAQENEPVDSSLPVFEFHSGFWVNLHHFLYHEARVRMAAKEEIASTSPKVDGPVLRQSGVASAAALTPGQQKSWDDAIAYYLANYAGKDQLVNIDLILLNNQLGDFEDCTELTGKKQLHCDAGLPGRIGPVLESVAPIYRAHWWADHDRANRRWVARVAPLVREQGVGLSERLADIYQTRWPKDRIRVEVCAYTNDAGAYTTLDPLRVMIASTDSRNQGPEAFEVLFHEASHSVALPVQTAINRECKQRDKPIPRNLWHALVFYTTGEVLRPIMKVQPEPPKGGGTREAKKPAATGPAKPNIVPYELQDLLTQRGWEQYHLLLLLYWQPYLDGKVNFEDAIAHLISAA